MAGKIRTGARTPFATLLPLLCSLSGAVHAQGLGIFSDGSDPLDGTTAERAAVLETLEASFLREQRLRLERAKEAAGDALAPFDEALHLERAREDFLAAASETLFELEGDGSLTLGEVATELPAIRTAHLRRFENVVEARSLGYAPPPRRGESDSLAEHVFEVTGYVVLARNPPTAWARLALYAGVGVLIALLLSALLSGLSRRIAEREHATLASTIDSVRVPLVLAAAAGGLLFGLDVLWLPAAVEEVARTTLAIVIIALAFLACWNLCDELADIFARMVRRATGQESIEHTERLIQRALSVLVVIVFLLVVSRVVLGVSLTGMIAGLGVVGIGLWILTRGLVENVAASFTLFGDRVFRIGDTIIHKDEWGVIESIGFRSTRCRTFDGHLLHIPNRNLVDDTVWNVSARPYIRRRFRLSLVYDTPPDEIEAAMDIVRSVIDEQGERVNQGEGVHVVFDEFGAHDLQLLVQFYTASDDYWTAKGVISDVNVGIRRRFEDAGIAFAFPTQTTVIESDADEPPRLRVEGVVEHEDESASKDGTDGERSGRGTRRESGESTRREGFDEAARAETSEASEGNESGDDGGDGR